MQTTLPYEILLRWNDAGYFAGGHTIRRDPVTRALAEPVPIGGSDFPWPAVCEEINATVFSANADLSAALEKERQERKEEKAALTAEAGRLQHGLESVQRSLAVNDPARARQIAESILMPANEELALLEARIAQLKAAMPPPEAAPAETPVEA